MGGVYAAVCVGVGARGGASARVGECACRGIRAGESVAACSGDAAGVHAGGSPEASCACGAKS